jgi:hypothetical protein
LHSSSESSFSNFNNKADSALGHSIKDAPYPTVSSLCPSLNQNPAFSTLTTVIMVTSKSTESKSAV